MMNFPEHDHAFVEDKFFDEVTKLIKLNAYTGNYGDGKIFVIPVDDV